MFLFPPLRGFSTRGALSHCPRLGFIVGYIDILTNISTSAVNLTIDNGRLNGFSPHLDFSLLFETLYTLDSGALSTKDSIFLTYNYYS